MSSRCRLCPLLFAVFIILSIFLYLAHNADIDTKAKGRRTYTTEELFKGIACESDQIPQESKKNGTTMFGDPANTTFNPDEYLAKFDQVGETETEIFNPVLDIIFFVWIGVATILLFFIGVKLVNLLFKALKTIFRGLGRFFITLKCIMKPYTLCLWLGVIALVLMAFFPPWNGFYRNGNVKIIKPLSYSFILLPPERTGDLPYHYGIEIDYKRLTMQFCVIALITGSSMYCFKKKSNELNS